MDVATAIANFDRWCQDNRSSNTRLLYRSRLRGLGSFTLEDGRAVAAIELDALTRENVEAWLAAAKKGKAPDTERANAIAFKAFQAWALDYGHLARAVVDRIKKPMGRQRDRIPEDDETAALLAHAPRAFVIMYTALRHSGARPNELCRATIADYDAKRSVIVLEQHKTAEKTGKPRKIGVGQVMRELLEESIGKRTEGPLFLSQRGNAWSPDWLSAMFRKLRNSAGLSKDLVLYLARHEHGTKICQKLGIYAAAEALGHKNIKTTFRYAHQTDKQRAANQDAFA
jgi:integrase